MTNQEAFDGIMEWLTRENAERCVSPKYHGDSCVYYNKDTGNRCAIGGHLPLDIAKTISTWEIGIQGLLIEGGDLDETVTNYDAVEKIREYYYGVNDNLLDELQMLHDAKTSWTPNGLSLEGYGRAAGIAAEYGLTNKFFYSA